LAEESVLIPKSRVKEILVKLEEAAEILRGEREE
jgi:hypothetical protein